MSKEDIENILGNINFEVETENEWVEPLGLDRDTWKQILNYITNLQQENNQLKERLKNEEKVIQEYLKIEEKIDQAIEYIKNNWYSKNTRNIEELHSLGDWRLDLLEILGDKE